MAVANAIATDDADPANSRSEDETRAIMEMIISMTANITSICHPTRAAAENATVADPALSVMATTDDLILLAAVPVPVGATGDNATAPNVAPTVGAAPVITATSAAISTPFTSFADACVTDGTNAAPATAAVAVANAIAAGRVPANSRSEDDGYASQAATAMIVITW